MFLKWRSVTEIFENWFICAVQLVATLEKPFVYSDSES